MKYQTIFLLSLIALLASCDQEVPLSAKEYGFSIGDPNGKLHIQFFLDFQCPDSKDAYNTLKQVYRTVDIAQQGIRVTYQFIPLQFHYYAFKIHMAFFYIWGKGGSFQAERFIDYVFAHQTEFTEEALFDITLGNFLDQLSTTLSKQFSVRKEELRKQLNVGSTSDSQARYHWKYAVGVHGISGAPIFSANSVRIDGAQNFTFVDWINFFKKYTA